MAQHHRKPTARLQGLRAQVRDYFALQGQRRKLFPRALLVGLLAGGSAVAFRWALEGGDLLRNRLIIWAYHAPTWGWLLPMLVGALGAGLAVGLVHRVAPEAAGSGIPHVKGVLYWFRSIRTPGLVCPRGIRWRATSRRRRPQGAHALARHPVVVSPPLWAHDEFERTYAWMQSWGLVPEGATYESLVDNRVGV